MNSQPEFKQKPLLVAFDFDHTISEENTDLVARNLLPPYCLTPQLQATADLGWTEYMSTIFKLLHKNGFNKSQITQAIISIPPVDGMLNLINNLYNHDCDLIIISDSNTFFINEWLNRYKLSKCFTKIFTNPGHFEKGILVLNKYHVQNWCSLSSVNLCKGSILEQFLEDQKKLGIYYDRVAYVGDGRNDYCPGLKLKSSDYLFYRENYALGKILASEAKRKAIYAKIMGFSSGSFIFETLKCDKVF